MGNGRTAPNREAGWPIQTPFHSRLHRSWPLGLRRGRPFRARAARTQNGCATDGNEMPPDTLELNKKAASPPVIAREKDGPDQGMLVSSAKVANQSRERLTAKPPSTTTSSGDDPAVRSRNPRIRP